MLRFAKRCFFPKNRREFAFLMLTTCSWEMCNVNVLLKGKGVSLAPLLGDVAGLQP